MKRKTQISKAAPKPEPGPGGKVFRLEDIDPEFVSLVHAGANRQKQFMVVKEDDAEKAVPAADASPEDKRKAQQARATQYGIEAREDGNLSYQAGNPTTESLYGDPVNLMYPFGSDSNQPDVGRIRNAVARFSQNRDEYQEKASKVKVLTRIVEAALRAGVAVTMPEGDDIYDALPAALRDRIKEKDDSDKGDGNEADGNGSPNQDESDLSSWLNEAGEKVAEISLDHAVQQALDAQSDGTAASQGKSSQEADEIDDTDPPPVTKAGEEAQQEDEKDQRIAKLEAELKKSRVENTALKAKLARLSKGVVKSSVMLTGEVTGRDQQQTTTEKTSPSRGAFLSGGDIAAAVEKD